jgi:hypothetical protein
MEFVLVVIFVLNFFHLLIDCVCVHQGMWHVRGVGVGSFYHVGPQEQTWVIRLGGKPLYLLSLPSQLGSHLCPHKGGSQELPRQRLALFSQGLLCESIFWLVFPLESRNVV